MIFKNNEEHIEYLLKVRDEKIKPLSRREAFREFIREFNEEAKEQNSKWFAEVHNKNDKREDYHFLHISKRLTTGWWIFKDITTVSLHIGYDQSYFSFVDNDYVFSEYGGKRSDKLFKLLPEFKSILEKIKPKFSILYNCRAEDFRKSVGEIKKEISKLQKEVM